jgi:hypothetical protein
MLPSMSRSDSRQPMPRSWTLTTGRRHPAPRRAGDRIVDDHHVWPHRANHARRRGRQHVGAKRQRRLLHPPAAANVAAARSCGRDEQHARVAHRLLLSAEHRAEPR